MQDIVVKPNLVMFQRDEGQGTKSIISINCAEISLISPKVSVLKEDYNKSVIRLKDGSEKLVIGTVQELQSQILNS
jgi:hypothetical protein